METMPVHAIVKSISDAPQSSNRIYSELGCNIKKFAIIHNESNFPFPLYTLQLSPSLEDTNAQITSPSRLPRRGPRACRVSSAAARPWLPPSQAAYLDQRSSSLYRDIDIGQTGRGGTELFQVPRWAEHVNFSPTV
jgi:hypothetical protein